MPLNSFLVDCGTGRKATFCSVCCVLCKALCVQAGYLVQYQDTQKCLISNVNAQFLRCLFLNPLFLQNIDFSGVFMCYIWTQICLGKFHHKHPARSTTYSIRMWEERFLLFRKCWVCVLHKSKSLSFKALGSVGGMSNLHSALFEAIDFERRSYANLKIPVCGSLALCSFSLY